MTANRRRSSLLIVFREIKLLVLRQIQPDEMVKYYTPEEVALHNNADDCWVSIYEKIYDLTALVANNRGILADPIIKSAGSSISHWFRSDTKDIKTFIDPERNIRMPFTPYGRFIHVPSPDPTDNCAIVDEPWWTDGDYVIGQVLSGFIRWPAFVIRQCSDACQLTVNKSHDQICNFNIC